MGALPHLRVACSKMAVRLFEWRSLVIFIFLHGSLQIAYCVSHKEKHYRYIQDVLKEVAGAIPPFTVEPPPLWFRSSFQSSLNSNLPDTYHYLRTTLILWDPVSQQTLLRAFVFGLRTGWMEEMKEMFPGCCLHAMGLLTWLVEPIDAVMAMQ